MGSRLRFLLEEVVDEGEDLVGRVCHIVSSVRKLGDIPIQVTNDRLSTISSVIGELFAIDAKQFDVQVETDT